MVDRLLVFLARQGRLLLIVGLVLGIVAPAQAEAMRPTIGPLVVFLLFLAVLRLGPEGLRAGMQGLRGAALGALALQMALPLAATAIFGAFGLLSHPLALGTVLVLAASPITGSPNIAVMAAAAPAPALRQLVVGTALLPLTVFPVFWLIPAFGSPAEVVATVLRLLGAIALSGGVALLLRHFGAVRGTERNLARMDGIAALALGVVVIGLMSAVGPALTAGGGPILSTLVAVMVLNTALQAGTTLILRGRAPQAAPAIGITAGNRNIALFLGVLPATLVDDLLLFIGCYQIPMYLTPFLFSRFYRRTAERAQVPR